MSYQLSVISYPQFPPGGDLIYLGIEAKRDRFCCEVSEPPQFPNSPIPQFPNP